MCQQLCILCDRVRRYIYIMIDWGRWCLGCVMLSYLLRVSVSALYRLILEKEELSRKGNSIPYLQSEQSKFMYYQVSQQLKIYDMLLQGHFWKKFCL